MKKLALPISVSKLVEMIGDQKNLRSSEIVKMISACKIKEADLVDWADFEHHKVEGYGREMMFKNDHFEIMVMSWAPRDYTAVHNHGYTKWGAVQTFGKLEHSTFELANNFLSSQFKQKLVSGDIISVNQSLIHQMGNPNDENVLSLHVYGTPLKVDGITDNSQLYEVGKGEVQLVNGGVFYDLPSSDIVVANADLYADRITIIGHFIQLLNYYLKRGVQGPQYRAAVNYFHDRSFESRLITELEMDSKGVLYMIELKKAKKLLQLLEESTKTIDSILYDINDPESYS